MMVSKVLPTTGYQQTCEHSEGSSKYDSKGTLFWHITYALLVQFVIMVPWGPCIFGRMEKVKLKILGDLIYLEGWRTHRHNFELAAHHSLNHFWVYLLVPSKKMSAKWLRREKPWELLYEETNSREAHPILHLIINKRYPPYNPGIYCF